MEKIELSERDLEIKFGEFLNDVYGACNIGGYSYDTDRALKEVDPVAYRCGFNDWLDSEIKGETIFESEDGKYYQL